MAEATIKVDGLRDLARTLRRLEDERLPRGLKAASKAAAQIVATEAAQHVPVRSGRLRSSIRAGGQQRGAVVRAGGARVPYAGWIEFGGTIRFKHKAGALHRPFVSQGRYIRPAARTKEREVIAAFDHAISSLLRTIR